MVSTSSMQNDLTFRRMDFTPKWWEQ